MTTTAQRDARRAEVARLDGLGLSLGQIAAQLGVSVPTVNGDKNALGIQQARERRAGSAPIGRAPVLDPGATEKPCPGRFCKGLVVKARADFRHDATTRDRMSWACRVCMTADDEDARRAKGAVPRRRGRKPRPAPTGKPPGTPAVYRPSITKADAAGWGVVIDIKTAAAAFDVSYAAITSPRSPVTFKTVSGRRKVLASSVIELLPDGPKPGGSHERCDRIRVEVGLAGPGGITVRELTARLGGDASEWVTVYLTLMVKRRELARPARGRYTLP